MGDTRTVARDGRCCSGLVAGLLAGLLACLIPAAPASAGALPSASELVKSRLLIDQPAVKPGEAFYAAIELTIAPGWHVYWKNPGDAGVATTVDWTLPQGYHADELQYPVPERIDSTGDITTYGYEKSVVLIARIVPGDIAPPPGAQLGATLHYLVCKDECIPGNATLSLALPTAGADAAAVDSSDVQPLLIQRWLTKVPQDKDPAHVASIQQEVHPLASSVSSFKAADVVLVVTWVVPQTADRPTEPDFFPVPGDALNVTKLRIVDYGDETRIMFHAETLAGATLPSPAFEGVITYMTRNSPRQAIRTSIRLADVKG